ncbi:MAG: hypothetical protein QXT72_00595 [Candidatus Micrarchaeia archaeon]
MIEIIRILIALAGTGIAAYYDIFNKKNVPELFLYSFLGISLLLNIFDYSLFLKFLPIAIPLVLVLYILYLNGQIGGADVIVLAAIYSALPAFPLDENQFVPSSLMVLAIATVLASIWIMIKYFPRIIKRFNEGKMKINLWQALQIILLLFSFALLIYMFMLFPFLPAWLLLVSGILFFESIFFIISKEQLMQEMVVMKKKIEPEDVIAIEMLDKKIIERYKIKRLSDEKQAKMLSKTGRKWPVLDMPMFLPFILIGLIIYILAGVSLI